MIRSTNSSRKAFSWNFYWYLPESDRINLDRDAVYFFS